MYIIDDGNNAVVHNNLQSNFSMSDIVITNSDVAKSLSMQSNKISCTPDSIPAFFLQKVAPYVLDVITYLFNLSIKSGTLPDQWKRAIVVPIFKRSSQYLPRNYRSISLKCVLCCVLDRILCKKLSSYLLENNLLSSVQFGFMPGKSSCSQLLIVLHTWQKF